MSAWDSDSDQEAASARDARAAHAAVELHGARFVASAAAHLAGTTPGSPAPRLSFTASAPLEEWQAPMALVAWRNPEVPASAGAEAMLGASNRDLVRPVVAAAALTREERACALALCGVRAACARRLATLDHDRGGRVLVVVAASEAALRRATRHSPLHLSAHDTPAAVVAAVVGSPSGVLAARVPARYVATPAAARATLAAAGVSGRVARAVAALRSPALAAFAATNAATLAAALAAEVDAALAALPEEVRRAPLAAPAAWRAAEPTRRRASPLAGALVGEYERVVRQATVDRLMYGRDDAAAARVHAPGTSPQDGVDAGLEAAAAAALANVVCDTTLWRSAVARAAPAPAAALADPASVDAAAARVLREDFAIVRAALRGDGAPAAAAAAAGWAGDPLVLAARWVAEAWCPGGAGGGCSWDEILRAAVGWCGAGDVEAPPSGSNSGSGTDGSAADSSGDDDDDGAADDGADGSAGGSRTRGADRRPGAALDARVSRLLAQAAGDAVAGVEARKGLGPGAGVGVAEGKRTRRRRRVCCAAVAGFLAHGEGCTSYRRVGLALRVARRCCLRCPVVARAVEALLTVAPPPPITLAYRAWAAGERAGGTDPDHYAMEAALALVPTGPFHPGGKRRDGAASVDPPTLLDTRRPSPHEEAGAAPSPGTVWPPPVDDARDGCTTCEFAFDGETTRWDRVGSHGPGLGAASTRERAAARGGWGDAGVAELLHAARAPVGAERRVVCARLVAGAATGCAGGAAVCAHVCAARLAILADEAAANCARFQVVVLRAGAGANATHQSGNACAGADLPRQDGDRAADVAGVLRLLDAGIPVARVWVADGSDAAREAWLRADEVRARARRAAWFCGFVAVA